MTILVFDRTMSYGMYYSVLCAEDADFTATDQNLDNIHPEIARAEKRGAAEFLSICDLWNVKDARIQSGYAGRQLHSNSGTIRIF